MNCGAVVYGIYCHICGQENVEPKETFWHLVTDFVYDITHFDGKFFSTVKYLLCRPGYLSLAYMNGKRNSYLNPIKLYVFTSAFFFIFLFSLQKNDDNGVENYKSPTVAKVTESINKSIADIDEALVDGIKPGKQDSIELMYKRKMLKADLARLSTDTSSILSLNYFSMKGFSGDRTFLTLSEYDSLQNTLPEARRDKWLQRKFIEKTFDWKQKYNNDWSLILKQILFKFYHLLPQILFVSLPFMALLLKLLYIRRKLYYYVDHIIFTVHLYCGLLILLFINMLLIRLQSYPYFSWVAAPLYILLLYIIYYVYKAMRNFYQQRRAKTLFKFSLLFLLSLFLFLFIGILFFIISAYTL